MIETKFLLVRNLTKSDFVKRENFFSNMPRSESSGSTRSKKSIVCEEVKEAKPSKKVVKKDAVIAKPPKETTKEVTKEKKSSKDVETIPIKANKGGKAPKPIREQALASLIPLGHSPAPLVQAKPRTKKKEPKKIFQMEIIKGYVLKVVFDTLAVTLSRCNINLNETGLYIRTADEFHTILFDLDFPRKNFKNFSCKKDLTISINLKHIQPLLKNVKKKDSIAMYIEENSGKAINHHHPRWQQGESKNREECHCLSNRSYSEPEALPEGGYKYPVILESQDFQKIKKLTSIGKQITVEMQDSNYFPFLCQRCIHHLRFISVIFWISSSKNQRTTKMKITTRLPRKINQNVVMTNRLLRLPLPRQTLPRQTLPSVDFVETRLMSVNASVKSVMNR